MRIDRGDIKEVMRVGDLRREKKNSMKFNKKRTNLIASKADDGNTQKQEIYTQ